MSLILCRHEPVRHPYYIERLGIHIASSQELCYVIYNNPLLAMEGLINDNLITFIRTELDMAFLAGKLDAARRAGKTRINDFYHSSGVLLLYGQGDRQVPAENSVLQEDERCRTYKGDGRLLFQAETVRHGRDLLRKDSG